MALSPRPFWLRHQQASLAESNDQWVKEGTGCAQGRFQARQTCLGEEPACVCVGAPVSHYVKPSLAAEGWLPWGIAVLNWFMLLMKCTGITSDCLPSNNPCRGRRGLLKQRPPPHSKYQQKDKLPESLKDLHVAFKAWMENKLDISNVHFNSENRIMARTYSRRWPNRPLERMAAPFGSWQTDRGPASLWELGVGTRLDGPWAPPVTADLALAYLPLPH